MFGIASNKKVKQLTKQVANLQQKSFTPTTYWIGDKTVSLFNFGNMNDIRTAVSSVPELASILNYTGKSFSLGEYQIKNNDKIIENHIYYDLFKNPNPLQNSTEFQQSVYENIAAYGVAYIYMNTPGVVTGTKGMMILSSWSVMPYVGDLSHKQLRDATDLNEIIKYYKVNTGTKEIVIATNQIISITQNTDTSISNGYLIYESPLKPLEDALQVTPAMYDTMQNLMNNGGMKGFVVNKTRDEAGNVPIRKKEKKTLQASFKDYGSKSGQYDVAFTNNDLDYVPITARIIDMLLPEQQKMIKTIIADIFGFDTAILNNDSANKYANYKEARKSLFAETIIPIANNFTEGLTNYLLTFRSEIITLNYSYLDVFSEDEKIKAETNNIESQLIINLNKSVFLGEMKRENAIEFLVLSGYEDLTAQKLIQ